MNSEMADSSRTLQVHTYDTYKLDVKGKLETFSHKVESSGTGDPR